MSWIIDRLRAEHANLERLVRLLDRRPELVAAAQAPHVALLVDALYYLTSFPDATHHPVEDAIAERLRMHGDLDADMAIQIEGQHETLARQGKDLLRDLESALRAETATADVVAVDVRLYAERLRHNIAVEELVLFPTADAKLEDVDWAAIEARMPGARPDPLFQTPVESRFADLWRVIAAEAGEPSVDAAGRRALA